MNVSNLIASTRLHAMLKDLTETMVDCAGDVETSLALAKVAKSMRDAVDQLEQLARSVPSSASVVAGQSAGNKRNRLVSSENQPASLSGSTSADDNGSSDSIVSEHDDDDDVVIEPVRPRRKKRRYRNENDVEELLAKGGKESVDGICVVDRCVNPVHTRCFCSGCYKAWLRATRTRQPSVSEDN